MHELVRRDSERVLRFVADAASLDGENAFPGAVLTQLGELIEADLVDYSELDLVRHRVLVHIGRPGDPEVRDSQSSEHVLWDIVQREHPIVLDRRSGRRDAVKLSDFVSLRDLRCTELHGVWFEPAGVERELVVCIPSPLTHLKSFMFHRERRDFSERDRAVANALQPHCANLWRAADTRRRLALALRELTRGREGNDRERPSGEQTGLTAREREVLAWVAQGKTNAQIAEILWISPATVRKHLENVYGKLGVSTRTAAVAAFLGLREHEEGGISPLRGHGG